MHAGLPSSSLSFAVATRVAVARHFWSIVLDRGTIATSGDHSSSSVMQPCAIRSKYTLDGGPGRCVDRVCGMLRSDRGTLPAWPGIADVTFMGPYGLLTAALDVAAITTR